MTDDWKRISEGVGSPTIKKLTYHKYINTRIIKCLNILGQKELATTIYSCGTWVELESNRSGRERISRANFCRERLCQVCAWRRSAKFFAQMLPTFHVVQKEGFKFIFITLTMKNVSSLEAPEAISTLLKAWDKMTRRAAYKRAWHGFVRSVEVTYNTKTNTYHPHIHAIIAVKQTYGMKSDKNYISQEQLQRDWGASLGVDYKPIVWMNSVKEQKTKKTETIGSALETVKYAFKVSFKSITPDTVATIQCSLRNRRLVSFGGVIAKIREQVLEDYEEYIDEPIDGELVRTIYKFRPDGWDVEETEEENETETESYVAEETTPVQMRMFGEFRGE